MPNSTFSRSRAFFNIDLEGLERLEKKLKELPTRMRNKILRKALNNGTNVIYEEAIRLCPRPSAIDLAESNEPHLVDAIAKRITVNKRRTWGRVGVDYTIKPTGHLVEFGHRIVIGRRDVGRRTRKVPFMRPSYDAKGDEAVDIMANQIYDYIFNATGKLK